MRTVFFLCYLAFFVQFYSLTRNYFRFRTTTRVTYQVDDVIPVPAVTICFSWMVPNFDLHLKAFGNGSDYFKKSYHYGDWLQSELGQKCKRFAETYSNKSELQMNDVAEAQYGCLVHYFNDPSVRQYLEGDFYGNYIWCSHSLIKQKKPVDGGGCQNEPVDGVGCRNDSEFCHRLGFVYSLGFWGKTCVSVYAKDNGCLRMDKAGSYRIFFYRTDIEQMYPYRIELHEAKATPRELSMVVLDVDSQYSVRYSRVVIKRLKPPFDSDCRRYHDDRETGAVSQSDCIARCFVQSLSRNASLGFFSHFFNYQNFVMHKELFPKEAKMSDFLTRDFPDIKKEEFRPLELDCEKECQPDCEETLYLFKESKVERVPSRKAETGLEHDFRADLFYEHLEEIGPVDYLSNVGGVAGMWVGVSLISCFSAMLEYLLRKTHFCCKFFVKRFKS